MFGEARGVNYPSLTEGACGSESLGGWLTCLSAQPREHALW